MARTPPPEKSRFKKGQSGNPLGGKLHNPEIRMMKNLTETEMVEIGSLVIKGSIKELKAIKDDPNTTVLKAMIASVAIKTIQSGNSAALDTLLNRLVGKAKERVEVTSTNQTNFTGAVSVVKAEDVRAILNKIRNDV